MQSFNYVIKTRPTVTVVIIVAILHVHTVRITLLTTLESPVHDYEDPTTPQDTQFGPAYELPMDGHPMAPAPGLDNQIYDGSVSNGGVVNATYDSSAGVKEQLPQNEAFDNMMYDSRAGLGQPGGGNTLPPPSGGYNNVLYDSQAGVAPVSGPDSSEGFMNATYDSRAGVANVTGSVKMGFTNAMYDSRTGTLNNSSVPPDNDYENPDDPETMGESLPNRLASPYEKPVSPYEQPISPYENPVSPYENPVSPYENPVSPYENPVLPYEQPATNNDNYEFPEEPPTDSYEFPEEPRTNDYEDPDIPKATNDDYEYPDEPPPAIESSYNLATKPSSDKLKPRDEDYELPMDGTPRFGKSVNIYDAPLNN